MTFWPSGLGEWSVLPALSMQAGAGLMLSRWLQSSFGWLWAIILFFPAREGWVIYLLRGLTQLSSGHGGNANPRTIRCCLQLWEAVHDQTLIFCCQFSIYHLWPNKAFPPAHCHCSLQPLMKCSGVSMGADIDGFFLELSFFTNSTEDVSRAPAIISVKHKG